MSGDLTDVSEIQVQFFFKDCQIGAEGGIHECIKPSPKGCIILPLQRTGASKFSPNMA
jgi:hypothetical protein